MGCKRSSPTSDSCHTLRYLTSGAGVGRKEIDGIVESELFARFRTHLGFESRFCNPYSGNEKGSVENAVGYLRRNLTGPHPYRA